MFGLSIWKVPACANSWEGYHYLGHSPAKRTELCWNHPSPPMTMVHSLPWSGIQSYFSLSSFLRPSAESCMQQMWPLPRNQSLSFDLCGNHLYFMVNTSLLLPLSTPRNQICFIALPREWPLCFRHYGFMPTISLLFCLSPYVVIHDSLVMKPKTS